LLVPFLYFLGNFDIIIVRPHTDGFEVQTSGGMRGQVPLSLLTGEIPIPQLSQHCTGWQSAAVYICRLPPLMGHSGYLRGKSPPPLCPLKPTHVNPIHGLRSSILTIAIQKLIQYLAVNTALHLSTQTSHMQKMQVPIHSPEHIIENFENSVLRLSKVISNLLFSLHSA